MKDWEKRMDEAKHDAPDGWVQFEGTDYETWQDAFWTGVLGFCGCGIPDQMVPLFKEYLETTAATLESRKDLPYEKTPLRKLSVKLGDSLYMLIAYCCDRADLTTHGGGVGSAWIEPKGREWLAKL